MGGISYTSLALAQIPNLFFDYMLLHSNPIEIFNEGPDYIFSPTRLFNLGFIKHSSSYLGLNSNYPNTILFNQVFSNMYTFKDINLKRELPLDFKLLEKTQFYSSQTLNKPRHDIEDLEYYTSATVSYENFFDI